MLAVTKSKTSFLQGMLFLFLAQTLVGVNIVLSKYIVSSIPVVFILSVRFTLAMVLLLPLHWLTPAKKTPISAHFSRLHRKDWFFIVAEALCAGVLFNFLMLWGLQKTDANAAGIITSALPAIIALMSALILGEKITGKKAACVGLATLGLVVIAGDKLSGVRVSHSFWGDVLVLMSLLTEATYYVLSKMHTYTLPVFLVSALLNGINALLLLPCLVFTLKTGLMISCADWLILITLASSTGFFYVFWYFGARKVDGIMASLSTAVMPLATVILAWMVLGEQLTPGQAIGMGMVLLSIGAYAKR